jgi:hypothetical protein
VPVLRNVRERDARDLRAGLDRAIPPEELRGATITLSNFGMIGGLFANLIAFSRRSRSWGLAGSPRAWWRMRVSLRCGACSRSRSPSTIVQSPAAKWLAFSWRFQIGSRAASVGQRAMQALACATLMWDADYATVAMRYALNDETVDRTSGRSGFSLEPLGGCD